MRRSYDAKKLARRKRKPAELLLVPMIDIFTVLVTFLLMTAVFSRTVVLQLNLPAQQAECKEPDPPRTCSWRCSCARICSRSRTAIPDRWRPCPIPTRAMTTTALTTYSEAVKAKFPEKTDASVLLESDIPYDTLVQVMDRVRVFEVAIGPGDASGRALPGHFHRRCPAMMSNRARRMAEHHSRHSAGAELNLIPLIDILSVMVSFLLVYSTEVEVIQNSKGIEIPAVDRRGDAASLGGRHDHEE